MGRRRIQSGPVKDIPVPEIRSFLTTTVNNYESILSIAEDNFIRLEIQEGDAKADIDRALDALRTFAAKVITKRIHKAKAPQPKVKRVSIGARQAVLELIEESHFEHEKELRDHCERIMAEVGI